MSTDFAFGKSSADPRRRDVENFLKNVACANDFTSTILPALHQNNQTHTNT